MADVALEGARYTFDFTGGALCLDFINTVGGSREHPKEHLRSYEDLLDWGRQAGVVRPDDAVRIPRHAARHPRDAARVLADAVCVREALFRTFAARVDLRAPEPADLDVVNEELRGALAHHRLAKTPGGFAWDWEDGPEALDRMLWPVLRSAADLLTSGDLRRVRRCAGPTCDWLFLDMSRNHSRRWCDMESCGNRAKARRYYERHRAHGNPAGTHP